MKKEPKNQLSRINLTLTDKEQDAVRRAIRRSEELGCPMTPAQAVRRYLWDGIHKYFPRWEQKYATPLFQSQSDQPSKTPDSSAQSKATSL
jgi:hypothetical protein